MDLTSLLNPKKLYHIYMFKNFVTSSLHSGICKNNRLKMYEESRGFCVQKVLVWSV